MPRRSMKKRSMKKSCGMGGRRRKSSMRKTKMMRRMRRTMGGNPYANENQKPTMPGMGNMPSDMNAPSSSM